MKSSCLHALGGMIILALSGIMNVFLWQESALAQIIYGKPLTLNSFLLSVLAVLVVLAGAVMFSLVLSSYKDSTTPLPPGMSDDERWMD